MSAAARDTDTGFVARRRRSMTARSNPKTPPGSIKGASLDSHHLKIGGHARLKLMQE
jgi:hypothetical protein